MGQGDADKGLGPAFGKTAQHALDTHAGVDHHRDDAGFEQAEDQREEIQAGPDHENGAGAPGDAGFFQTAGDAVGIGVQLGEGEMGVGHPAVRIATDRRDDGLFIGKGGRHGF